jgi:hypothetical protein
MIKKFMCFIGFHRWDNWLEPVGNFKVRYCKRCHKQGKEAVQGETK